MCSQLDRIEVVIYSSQRVISNFLKHPFIFLIRIYRWFSPIKQIIFGPYARCRFYPTCSEYSLECVRQLPLLEAIGKSLSRIAKCNPMHPGGYDPLFPAKNGEEKPESSQ